jgi:hypothetical protein
MPYIEEKDRNRVQFYGASSEGELNYLITLNCLDYVDEIGESYASYNAVIGALECAKLEMYRRMIAPYEDKKIKENGDVY